MIPPLNKELYKYKHIYNMPSPYRENLSDTHCTWPHSQMPDTQSHELGVEEPSELYWLSTKQSTVPWEMASSSPEKDDSTCIINYH